MRFFIVISLLLTLSASARDLSHRRLLLSPKQTPKSFQSNTTIRFNRTALNTTNPQLPPLTSMPHEIIKPQVLDLNSPPTPLNFSALGLASLDDNVSSILAPLIDLFAGSMQKPSGAKPSPASSSPRASAPNLDQTSAQMQAQLAANIAQMQELQRSLSSDPQAAARVACDLATVTRFIAGIVSPTSLYSTLVSGRGSGVAGGNALSKVISATNAGSTFSQGCSELSQSTGKQTLSSAVTNLLGPSNDTAFARGLIDLTNFLDTASASPKVASASSLVPSYLDGTQLGNVLSSIEAGLKSFSPLANYNASQLVNQILTTYDSLLGGNAGTGLLNLQGGLGTGTGSTLLAEIQKLFGSSGGSTGGIFTSSSGLPSASNTGLATAFANGWASAFGKKI